MEFRRGPLISPLIRQARSALMDSPIRSSPLYFETESPSRRFLQEQIAPDPSPSIEELAALQQAEAVQASTTGCPIEALTPQQAPPPPLPSLQGAKPRRILR